MYPERNPEVPAQPKMLEKIKCLNITGIASLKEQVEQYGLHSRNSLWIYSNHAATVHLSGNHFSALLHQT
jgi:hypothetical protein